MKYLLRKYVNTALPGGMKAGLAPCMKYARGAGV